MDVLRGPVQVVQAVPDVQEGTKNQVVPPAFLMVDSNTWDKCGKLFKYSVHPEGTQKKLYKTSFA